MIQALVEIILNALLTVVLGVVFIGIHLFVAACYVVHFFLQVRFRFRNWRLSFKHREG